MQFSVGDKVVHPRHGAGRITGIQQQEVAEGAKRYFVIEIPAQRLTVYVPSQQMEQIGVRLAMPRGKVPGVLDTLQSKPHYLPEDHLERQKRVWEKLGTGRVMQLAEVVRDLNGYRQQSRLTKKDSEYLNRGREWLAAEMALASDTAVSEANQKINAALEASMGSTANQE